MSESGGSDEDEAPRRVERSERQRGSVSGSGALGMGVGKGIRIVLRVRPTRNPSGLFELDHGERKVGYRRLSRRVPHRLLACSARARLLRWVCSHVRPPAAAMVMSCPTSCCR